MKEHLEHGQDNHHTNMPMKNISACILLLLKLGCTGECLFSLFLIKNIDCGYSLQPPRRGGPKRVPTINVLSKCNNAKKKTPYIAWANFRNVHFMDHVVIGTRYRSRMILVDYRHRFTVIHMNHILVPIGQIYPFYSYA